MKPDIILTDKINPDQSVVCILGSNEIPEHLVLSKTEKEYAVKRLEAGDESVVINSYYKNTYLIRQKDYSEIYRSREEVRKSAFNIRKTVKSNNHEELVITSYKSYKGAVEDFTEGFILSIYSFDRYKTVEEEDGKKSYPVRLLLHGEVNKEGLDWLKATMTAVYFARDLINEPPNHLNASALAGEIKKISEKSGFSVEVMNKGKIQSLKMGGLLAVNRGSVDPPVFCVLEWNPPDHVNSKPLVLIGKGIIYDTGGINIKTGEHMDNMKTDMAGAAAVAGVIYTAAMLKMPVHVVGLIPATDNRPGGNAYVQGDIITMHNGMTVEVGNTDAEGRLILADALSYASRYEPELVITIATLTGSAAMTFGNKAIAVMGNAGDKYFDLLGECGNETYERIAKLPFWDEYGELIKSDIADIKNVGGREAGAITAGKFLERFSEYPMIHLDIAGTGSLKKDDFYRLKNGPASGLRLLSCFLKKYSENYLKNN
ncbi:MAG: leucyl aminopeptidase family protein [Bacteroidales bacterium]|nr:leucyl aminopeptidase family protein [Bacteroidales bacterium]